VKDAGFAFALAGQPVSADPTATAVGRITGSGGDVENGRLFAAMFQNKLLCIHETDEWLHFDARRGWLSAEPGAADRAAKEVLRELRDQAANYYKTAPDDPKTKRLMAHVKYTSRL
jgi:hypothetical protein